MRKDGRERVQKLLSALLISLFLHYERSKMFTAFFSFQQQICEHSSGKLRWLSITCTLGRHVFIYSKIKFRWASITCFYDEFNCHQENRRPSWKFDWRLPKFYFRIWKKVIEGRVLLITAAIRLFSVSASKNKKKMRKLLRGRRRLEAGSGRLKARSGRLKASINFG